MRRPGGYAVAVAPDGSKPIECDTITCAHCNSVVLLHKLSPTAGADLGGYCRQCMANICGPCADRGYCSPFLKRIERAESLQYRRNQLLKAGG